MNLFSADNNAERQRRTEATRRIKAWVERLISLETDAVVHVAELRCHEPDCPDFETVITLMSSDSRRDRSVKLPKPLVDVTETDISSASFTSTPPCQHEGKQP
jgi:hypothetical protein